MPVKTFEELDVYRRAVNSLVSVYKLVKKLPDYEKFELGSQMRRACVSVPCNIAEGFGRDRSVRDFKHFLSIA